MLRAFRLSDEGATMVEYALMLTLVALVCLAAIGALGGSANGVFSNANLLAAL